MTKKSVLICFLSLWIFAGSIDAIADQYTSGVKRDPFVPLLGVEHSNAKQGLEDICTIDDVDLQGILAAPGGKKGVIVNGEVINEGEKKGIFSIKSVSDNSVIVLIGDETFEIKLYEQ